MKKKVAFFSIALLVIAYVIFNVVSYATNKTMYIGLNITHSNGQGYGIGNPTDGGVGLWNLRNYDSSDRNNESAKQKELYCIKGDYGDSWEENKLAIIQYNLEYDLDTEREKLLTMLAGDSNTANDVVTRILSDNTSGVYRELLWVIDNAYIPGKSDKDQLLKKLGIEYDSTDKLYVYKPNEEYDYTDKIDSVGGWSTTLTETDIKAVQQAVFWYFTNAKLDNDSRFDNTSNEAGWLTITVNDGNSYTHLSNYTGDISGEGVSRNDQANILYNYLIDSATKNADKYTSSGYKKPVEVNVTGLTTNTDGKYELQASRNGENYITGPIKITKNNDLNYNLELKVTNASTGAEINSANYTITDKDGKKLGITDITELAELTDGFYISVPTTVAKEINVDITTKYTTKTKNIWLEGKENSTTSITLNSEQPVLEIEEQENSDTVQLTANPKEFDLALRKYITKVNDKDVTDTRVPDIDLSTLQSGTTATYKHRKDPVLVENGNSVTYKITIYNEGNKKGYAKEITDQLPTGLKYTGPSSITTEKNTYNVTYNSTTNKITFSSNTTTALNEYQANSLDSETLEFTCEVTATSDSSNEKILTNVAWISSAYDSDAGKEITNVGDDRDSRPQTSPNVNKDNMENYKGNSSNKSDFTDSTYYYQGEQDDDDFEKLVIEPKRSITVTKTWSDNNDQDGLRKNITSVTVNLLANNKIVKTADLTSANSWSYTFTDLPLKENGTMIEYTVSEASDIAGYDTSVNGFTITNTHVPETIDIPVTKEWYDNNNNDGIRPDSIKVILKANGEKYKEETITSDMTTTQADTREAGPVDNWEYTFKGLPKYKDGNEIEYTIEEVTPEGYTTDISGNAKDGFTISNYHELETISFSVKKVWNDSNNQDGKRPEEIILKLISNNDDIGYIILTAEGGYLTSDLNNRGDKVSNDAWAITVDNIPKYNDGTEVKYTIEEQDVPDGYQVEINGDTKTGFTVTNTHKIFDLALRKYITKVNGTNVANTRVPVISEDTLQNGTTATYKHRKDPVKVEEGNTVTYQITVYNEGQKTGYASQIIDQLPIGLKYSGGSTVISKGSSGANKNTYNVNYDSDANRITFNITGTPSDLNAYSQGKLDKETIEIQCTVMAEPDTTNKKILTNVAWISGAYDTENNISAPTDRDSQPGTSPDANKDNMENYKGNTENKDELTDKDYYYKGEQDDDDFEKLVIEPESTSISVRKVWEDNNNQDGKRATEITVQLLANGNAVEGKTAKLNADNNWNYTFTGLAKKSNGTELNYTVEETTVPDGYTKNITGSMTNGFVITNSHTPEKISIPVKKVWEDNDNQDGKRPTNITITLKANGEEVDGKTVQLKGTGNEWTYTFTDLPKYANGSEIQYSVEETGIPQGYESNKSGDMTNGFTITNKYTPEKIDIPAKKIWVDNNNQDGIRPNEIELILKANGTEKQRQKINGTGNEWTYTFTDLPKYEAGKEITYTIEENGIPAGYKSLTSGDATTGFVITNTYTPGTTSVKVTKVWNDNNNQDGLRPTSVSVSLIANGDETNPVETVELNSDNSWTYTFTDLPEKSNGEKINYTIIENTKIDGYTTQITNDNVSSTAGEVTTASAPEYTITNTHDTEEISINVTKVWNDENDYDKIRPTSVVVNVKNGDKIVGTATLSAENEWKYTFENLQAKQNGEKINYVIEEVVPDGYKVNITDDGANNYTITNTHSPNKTFDLALRKYITQINNNDLTSLGLASRIPNVSESTLKTGTTATYKHRKDPIQVEEGDIITYKITIYNEGEKAGYANQIIDQLPTGLIYNPSSTVISKDSKGNDKNTYSVKYEASTNKVTFDIVNTAENTAKELQPYSTGNLDNETIELKCKVIYKAIAGDKNILTNVAWINEAYNTTDNKKVEEVGDDRDSEPSTKPNVNKDNMEDYKGNTSNKNDLSDSSNYYKGEQDDDDFEKLYVKTFDLSLRKFITSVEGTELKDSNGKYTREPIVDITGLKNGTSTTAVYRHPKTPVSLKAGDKVIYTIRVYNEGEIAGYANQVKDYLPKNLTYLKDSEINKKYGWEISEDGRVATTTYLSDKEINEFDGSKLDYKDVQIECIVASDATPDENITNIAEISEYKYGDTVVPKDVDSESDNVKDNIPEDQELPNYKKDQEKDEYVPGNEDDDDFEKVYVKEFDLALRKFITEVQGKEITTREPQVKYQDGKISYEHTKDPVTLHVGDVVIYTLRIYNEGEIAGYASKITDDIPEYLEYLPDEETNVKYMWKLDEQDGNKVTTDYLSKENGESNLLNAFDGNTLYYKDIKIAFKVKDPGSNTYIITNHAQISDDTDENGNEIKDKDSETDKWNEGEDDQDIENVKVEYFDLSILKFVSKVIVQENGQEKITQTGYNGHEDPEPVVKVELHKKKLQDVVVKFGYGITVTNEGDIPGYATELTDYIPEGLKFETSDNPNWVDEGNNVISTKQLENTLLQPGESATVEVVLTWINGPDNMALKTNTVEISEDKNQYDLPDRDSTPDNRKEGEDDIDIAKVILAVSTGKGKTYFILATGLLAIIATGVITIKKFVL